MNENYFSFIEYSSDEPYLSERENLIQRLQLQSKGYKIKAHDYSHLILNDGVFVGAFKLVSWLSGEKSYFRINWLAVTEESEKNGWHTGTEILNFCLAQAISQDAVSIRISVNRKNKRAFDLYERFCFIEVGFKGNEIDMEKIVK